MTLSAALLTLALLAQSEPEAAPAAPPPAAPPAQPVASPPIPSPGPAVPGPTGTGTTLPKRTPTIDQLQHEMERIKRLPVTEQGAAVEELNRRYKMPIGEDGKAAERLKNSEPLTPKPFDVTPLMNLSEPEQVKRAAREFFDELVAGNARGLVERAALPFQLEERRIPTYEELFGEWLKSLRSKRTDLLTLYDIEVLTPAEMEKKYGKPPARLQNLQWKAPRTWVAVANLSGHAAVAVFKPAASMHSWVVVGYTD